MKDPQEYDVGFIDGSAAVTMRTTEDVTEVWINILKGQKVTLWCDGLKSKDATNAKCSSYQGGNNDGNSFTLEKGRSQKKRKVDDNEEHQSKVDEVFQDLKKNHGESYTRMQLRIWSEMNVGGLHNSLDDPPNTSMFIRAGGGNSGSTKRTANDDFTKAITQIASVLKPTAAVMSSSSTSSSSCSPAKVIENRSKCYKQLSELQSLKDSGLFDDTEYSAEREAIMSSLKKLASS